MTLVTDDGASLLTPIFPGDEVRATFFWTRERRVLEVSWPADQDAPTLSFGPSQAGAGQALEVSADAQRLCRCYNRVFGEQDCPTNARSRATGECRAQCSSLATAPSREWTV